MLYLRGDLIKGKDAADQTGEQRGGKYAARLQVGYEKDGSPRYKYFETLADRDQYLQEKGESKDPKKKLKHKLEKEQKESKEKTREGQSKLDSGKLFVSKDKKDNKKEEETKKSFPVFIWRLE